jgi:conjugative transfer signal peptidase TraF
MSRSTTLALTAAATTLMAATIGPKPAPRVVWNASESVPIGFYRVQPPDQLNVSNLVIAFPPEQLATVLAEGGYLPRGVPLIKRVLALPLQIVCRQEMRITVDGIDAGTARERDRRGRLLPSWQGCRALRHGEVFLMNPDKPTSLDGRYFGPLPVSVVIGRAVPLWIFQDE